MKIWSIHFSLYLSVHHLVNFSGNKTAIYSNVGKVQHVLYGSDFRKKKLELDTSVHQVSSAEIGPTKMW